MTALDVVDWAVDTVREACGLPPLPPQLVKLAFERQPTVRFSTALQIELRRVFFAFLRIRQEQQILFEGAPPRDGRVAVTPLSSALIDVHLKLEARHPTARNGCVIVETVFEPLANGPSIERFDLPRTISLGENLTCGWHAPAAKRVHLAIIGNGEIAEHIEPASGQIVLSPSRPGRLRLRLTAEAEWGQATLVRSVDVIVPKLRIELMCPAVQAGHPGEEVRFEWRTFAADNVWLVPPDGADPQLLPHHDGFLLVTLGWQPVEFRLVARGHAGAECNAVLRAEPQPFASLEQ